MRIVNVVKDVGAPSKHYALGDHTFTPNLLSFRKAYLKLHIGNDFQNHPRKCTLLFYTHNVSDPLKRLLSLVVYPTH